MTSLAAYESRVGGFKFTTGNRWDTILVGIPMRFNAKSAIYVFNKLNFFTYSNLLNLNNYHKVYQLIKINVKILKSVFSFTNI